ncbi:maleylacetate reductase (plasmid) [Rhizobium leguminosarum]|uniref:maleylacetate reductase n=1 Tax=Rhizobium leguminosarum TaxID=384 RepID=UPI00102F5B69|nr:maleylacetate reductase [Rhizobium leguminosarum]TBC60639.1 maleylacetate reductase [Rhizobium leguminosarum]
MQSFVYNGQPARVIFGSGTLAQLPAEVDRLGLKRVLILATPPQAEDAEKLSALLGTSSVGVYSRATMHTPVDVTEDAMRVVADKKVDGLIAVGGGSTTGLAKAIALRTDLPQIVAPTTYAGSEMTPILGETKDGQKVTQSSPKILPEVVIYDVDLTLTLPVGMSGTSGMNAIAHAIEALYAKERNPVVSLMALEAIQALARSLPLIHDDPSDRAARSDALYGAWLCGICLGSVGMALHHKLCHTLGGSFDLPHAETHTVVLPHALAYNAPAIPEVIEKLRDVLGHQDPAVALFELAGRIGAPRSLREIGMPEHAVDVATERALANPYWNPQPLERDGIRALIARAYAGDAPAI